MSGSPQDPRDGPLLAVENLRTHFHTERGVVRAIDGVSFTLDRGRTLGVVGESGSGKTTFGRAITRLMDLDGGKVMFDGKDLFEVPLSKLRAKRREFQMLFQNPASTLHPRMTVRQVLAESLKLHRGLQGGEPEDGIADLLEKVQLPTRAGAFPGELSGGQQRRIGVA